MDSSTARRSQPREKKFTLRSDPKLQLGSPEMRAAVQKSIDNAIAEGRHSKRVYAVCYDCRRQVDGIYYINFQGAELCAECSDKIGMGPKADAAKLAEGKR